VRLWLFCAATCLSLFYIHFSTSLIISKEVKSQNDAVLDVNKKFEPFRVNFRREARPIHVDEHRGAVAHKVHEQSKKAPPPLWPNPSLVVGLPKVGTKTISGFFTCGNITKISHYLCANNIKCGLLIHENVLQNKPPLHGTGDYNVYTQLDITAYSNRNLTCYYPQVELLEELHEHHPHSTLILNQRNVTSWVASVKRWFGMHDRLVQCNISGFRAGVGRHDDELVQFYNDQLRRVREFVVRHPTHRLVEVAIDTPTAGQVMEDAFGIDRSCWGHGNKADVMQILNQ
jgi:hypothetical protein